ncbi:MAG: hypothetical protein WAP36_07390, partial [Halanaerobiales bacterium]
DKQNQKKDNSRGQMALFEERKNRRQEEILEKLINKNLFNLTPIEAMNFLYQLQEEARKGIR